MLKTLLDDLHRAYPGNEIYVPHEAYSIIVEWAKKQYKTTAKISSWKGKKLVPYYEDHVRQAYLRTPVYLYNTIFSQGEEFCFCLESKEDEEKVIEQTAVEPARVEPERPRETIAVRIKPPKRS